MRIPIIAIASLITMFFVIAFAAMVATRIVYGFSFKAICGLQREAKRNYVMYVSRGPIPPVGVFWLGSEDWQEDKVAHGFVSGELPIEVFREAVSSECNWNAIVNQVNVWPSEAAKRLYGKPEDIAA